MKTSKTASLITVTLFGLLPQLVSASVFSCPNTQLGAFADQTGAPVIYSDCAVTTAGIENAHLWLAGLGTIVVSEGSEADDFSPQPGTLNIGEYEPGTIALADMGAGYSGQCGDMDTSSSEERAAIDGHTYCTQVRTTAGHTLWIRGTWNDTGDTFDNIGAWTDAPIGPPMPVPTVPPWALLLSVLGVLGLARRLSSSSLSWPRKVAR